MQTYDVPMELKAARKSGSFQGYGAVFGNKDLGNDIILPGAFEEVRKTKDGQVRIALYHDLWQLVGKAKFSQDDKGLYLDGQMNMNVSYAKDAYELMKDGTLDGMSVGFNILPGGSEFIKGEDGDGVQLISKAELWEVSIVPFGMNPEAKIDRVKQAFMGRGVRAFENHLKEDGFSRKEAAAMVSFLQKSWLRDAGQGSSRQSGSGAMSSEMLGQLKSAIAHFKIN